MARVVDEAWRVLWLHRTYNLHCSVLSTAEDGVFDAMCDAFNSLSNTLSMVDCCVQPCKDRLCWLSLMFVHCSCLWWCVCSIMRAEVGRLLLLQLLLFRTIKGNRKVDCSMLVVSLLRLRYHLFYIVCRNLHRWFFLLLCHSSMQVVSIELYYSFVTPYQHNSSVSPSRLSFVVLYCFCFCIQFIFIQCGCWIGSPYIVKEG